MFHNSNFSVSLFSVKTLKINNMFAKSLLIRGKKTLSQVEVGTNSVLM